MCSHLAAAFALLDFASHSEAYSCTHILRWCVDTLHSMVDESKGQIMHLVKEYV